MYRKAKRFNLIGMIFNIRRYILIVLIEFLIESNTYAQEPHHKFYLNVYHTLRYPDALKDSCVAVYTHLLLDINGNGKITDIQIADSSPQVLRSAFADVKSNLHTELLSGFLRNKKLKNCGILIPVFFVYADGYCSNSFEDQYFGNKYMKFNGQMYNKLVYAMPPLIYKMSKPMQ